MKYFDENSTKVTDTLTTLNHFQMNEKDTSKNLLSPKSETEDLTTNSHISLSDTTVYNHQQSTYPIFLPQRLRCTRNTKQN